MSGQRLRALIAVGLLAGFYLTAFGVLTVCLSVIWILLAVGDLASPLGIVLVALVGISYGLARGLLRLRRSADVPVGIPLPEQVQPRLWSEVRELAEAADATAPDEIRLTLDVNAAVTEASRLLGLVPGTRRLYVGAPLLLGITHGQLRAVIAHELGHYSHRHTQLAPVVHHGMHRIAAMVEQLGPHSVLGRLVAAFGVTYWRFAGEISRQQEFEADLVGARVAGTDAMTTVLTEVGPLTKAWDHFMEYYATAGLAIGRRPDRLLEGFHEFLADPRRRHELDILRQQDDETPPMLHDTHPPLAERVARLRATGWPRADLAPESAMVLLDDLDATIQHLEAMAFSRDLEPTPWPELLALHLDHATAQRAQLLVQQAEHRSPGAGTLRALIADQAGGTAQRHLGGLAGGSFDERSDLAGELVGDVIAAALLQRGLVSFDTGWGGRAPLLDGTGSEVDPWRLASAARLNTEYAERLIGWLTECGLDVDAPLSFCSNSDRTTVIQAAIGPIGLTARHALIVNDGVVFVPGRLRDSLGRWTGLHRHRLRRGESRLREIVALSGEQLTDLHGAHLVKWDEIDRVDLREDNERVAATLQLRSGGSCTIYTDSASEVLGRPGAVLRHHLGPRVLG